MNTSVVENNITARTNPEAAAQRAENLSILGTKKVLELCVGPSLKVLEHFYRKHKIAVTGNDIEARWEKYYPSGKWVIGDALAIPYTGHDTVVFAPPLSKGCTGTREDSLSVDEVFPKYTDFIFRAFKEKAVKTFVLVLPARSLATGPDRAEFHHLLHVISQARFKAEIIPLRTHRRKITKYVDIYMTRE